MKSMQNNQPMKKTQVYSRISICRKAKKGGTSRNLKFEKSQDYAQKPQPNSTPMNSIPFHIPFE